MSYEDISDKPPKKKQHFSKAEKTAIFKLQQHIWEGSILLMTEIEKLLERNMSLLQLLLSHKIVPPEDTIRELQESLVVLEKYVNGVGQIAGLEGSKALLRRIRGQQNV